MERRFEVDRNALAAHLACPPRLSSPAQPGVVIAHGFPAEAGGGINSTRSFPDLADAIAAEHGWAALTYSSRGVAGSGGSFSLQGWLRDLQGAVAELRQALPVAGVWIIGFGTGGALAIAAAAADPEIRGVAAVAAPADFQDWARSPRKLLVVARDMGIISDDGSPGSFKEWAAELGRLSAVGSAAKLAPRELMLVHGSNDEVVPLFDARAVADSHGSADLRVVYGGAHHLRHDPRAIAILLGWLERQRRGLLQAASG